MNSIVYQNPYVIEDHFLFGLDTPLNPQLIIGKGTILCCSGWCFHRDLTIKNIFFLFPDTVQEVLYRGIYRDDIARTFAEIYEANRNLLFSGFWIPIPFEKIASDQKIHIIIKVILGNDEQIVIQLPNLLLVSSEPLNEQQNPKKEIQNWLSRNERDDTTVPRVLICLATYDPNRELFIRQISSIQDQSYPNWKCLINDDCSDSETFTWICDLIKDDDRFFIRRNEKNVGFYYNFERLLALAPPVDFIALSDQDDYWHREKLERLVREFDNDTTLVYSDMRIVRKDGSIVADSYWNSRNNYYQELDYLILVNTITGAASIFRYSLVEYLLPFPCKFDNSYHDHWIGCMANTLGEIRYIDEPLYDYLQHESNVLGQSSFAPTKRRQKILLFFQLLLDLRIKTLVYYQKEFFNDGIEAMIIAQTIRMRVRSLQRKKRASIDTFLFPKRKSRGIFLLFLKTVLNQKTTGNAELYLLKEYWADKLLRYRIFR